MTYEEFLDWADEDTFAEWVDGEVVELSPAKDWHQGIVGFLSAILRHFCESYDLGIILVAPFQMKTGPRLPGREPDVIFIAREHLNRLKENYLDGPADLVVEVVSPDSRRRDREEKLREYEEGGVREYWLIDKPRKQAEFYQPGDDGRYKLAAVDDDGVYRSAVLNGLWIEVEWLWQEPLPKLLDVIKLWNII
jgi:Uma2 family endonuclease